MNTPSIDDRMIALGKHLADEDTDLEYGDVDNEVCTDVGDFLVLTDSEADDAVREYIKESVWAFNADFLASHIEALDADDITRLRGDKCEDINDALIKLIDDFDSFVDDAVSADGRGHFLSGYDGDELELEGDLYAYRVH